jgi:hypothetical protein
VEVFTKRIFWLSGIAAALALLTVSTGCHSATPIQAGVYNVEMNGQIVKVAKVTQAASGYDMAWFDNGQWIPVTGPVKALSKAELGRLVTGPVDDLEGLQSKELTILFVPKGWTQVFLGHGGVKNTEFKAGTGYVWISRFGFMDLKKL